MVLLFAYCLIALLPFLSSVQVSDTTGDATSTKAGNQKLHQQSLVPYINTFELFIEFFF